jgi:general secretion pathway protein D
VVRPDGIRVQNILMADSLMQRFLQTIWGTAGGLSLQYLLVDDVSVSAILRMVEKADRGHVLNAPKLTLFNTQRGNTLISNQMAYIRDFNVQIGGAQVVPDPEIAVVNDGISMDVRPIVSPDRRFVTLELRPTVAVLTPPPPAIATIETVIGGTAAGAPPGRVIQIETPEIEVQRLRTTVVVPDRGTMIVGGLTVFFDVDTKSEVPLWRNIPILGTLGSEKILGRDRNQLLIIVRAEIVIPDEREEEAY